MYGIQRKDALADWNMQNFYNSPAEQMKRLKDAKLNPNLVYGTGAVANNASAPRASSPGNYSPRAPQVDLQGPVMAGIANYYNTRMQKVNLDNAALNGQLLEQERYKKLAETLSILQGTKGAKLDYDIKDRMKDTIVAAASAGLRQTEAQTNLTMTETEIKQVMAAPNFAQAVQDLLNSKKDALLKDQALTIGRRDLEMKLAQIDEIKARVSLMQRDGQLKDFDLMLKNARGKASDYPGWMKPIVDIFNSFFDSITDDRPKKEPEWAPVR